ncbi:glycosyltransferase family 4 protein, partial [Elusimicrobiota bacterium]
MENRELNNSILHILNIPWNSGLASYSYDMGKYEKELGAEVFFAVVSDSVLFNQLKGSFSLIGFRSRKTSDSLIGLISILKTGRKFTTVYAHTGSGFFIGIILKIISGCRVIRVRAQAGKIKNSILNRYLHGLADSVIAPTEAIREDYRKIGIAEEKIIFLPPVVETSVFTPSPIENDNVLALVGRLSRVKGHEVLFNSLAEIKDNVPGLKIILAGNENPGERKELIRAAEKLAIDPIIEFKGFLEEVELIELMKSARFGIIPSLGSEAVSRVALEWMACGRPIIASRVGMLSEIVRSGYNGYLFEPGSALQLSQYMIKLLEDQELNIELGENARRFVKDRFSPGLY